MREAHERLLAVAVGEAGRARCRAQRPGCRGLQPAHGVVGVGDQRVGAVLCVQALQGAGSGCLQRGAARNADQLAVGLDDQRHRVLAQRHPRQQGVDLLERQVRRDDAERLAVFIQDALGAGGDEFADLEVDINRGPCQRQPVGHGRLVPGALARVEDPVLLDRRTQLAAHAGEAEQGARAAAGGAQPQLGFLGRVAPQAEEVAVVVAVVDIVVRVSVDGGGQPEAFAQRVQLVRDIRLHAQAGREGGLEHRVGAAHMAGQ
mmetsp:Transcript_11496/g.46478  ORF Transcript_11496/g.46478 Transcript_11496/m.46478 type:complete len:261 (+) Transcript_11496:1849-2631(+)